MSPNRCNFDMSFGFIAAKSSEKLLKRIATSALIDYAYTTEEAMLTEALPLNVKMDWSGEYVKSRSTQYQINAWALLSPLLNMANVDYFDSQKTVLIRKFVAAWCCDWAKRYSYSPDDPTGSQSDNSFAWYDMAAGLRAAALGHLLTFSDAEFYQEGDRIVLENSAADHLAYLRDPAQWASHSNHGLYQSMGLLALVSQAPDCTEFYQKDKEIAIKRIADYLDKTVSVDGVHLEHSPIYHSFVLKALRSIAPILDADNEKAASLLKLYDEMQDVQALMFMPNNLLLPFGDSRYMSSQNLASIEAGTTEHMTPKLQHIVTDGAQGEASESDIFASPSAGLAVYKDGGYADKNSYLAVSSWHHSAVHKQVDDAAAVWAENNVPILSDPGRFGYEGKTAANSLLRTRGFYYDDPRRIYVESAHAHNTIEIDRETDNRRKAPPYGSGLTAWGALPTGEFVTDIDVCREKLVHHKRLYLYTPGQQLIIIDDVVSMVEKPRLFSVWWQFFPTWRAKRTEGLTGLTLQHDASALDDSFDSLFTVNASTSGESSIGDDSDELTDGASAAYQRALSKPNYSVSAGFSAFEDDGNPVPLMQSEQCGNREDEARLMGWTSLYPGILQPSGAVELAPEHPLEKVTFVSVFQVCGEKVAQPKDFKYVKGRRGLRKITWDMDGEVQSIRFRRTDNALEIYRNQGVKNTLVRKLQPRNVEAQWLLRARAAIINGRDEQEITTCFDQSIASFWTVAVSEYAAYAKKIGDIEKQLSLAERASVGEGGEQLYNLAIALLGTQENKAQNVKRAERLFLTAAEKNIRGAHYYLGQIYDNPDYDCVDMDKAFAHYKTGAQLGHAAAALRVAEIFKSQDKTADSVIWYEKAADDNNRDAVLYLAEFYSDEVGSGTLYNPERGLEFYTIAAKLGSKVAGYNGGQLALNKAGPVYSLEKAKLLFGYASDAGSAVATFELAELLVHQEDQDQDQEYIKTLYLKALSMGVGKAQKALDTFMKNQ